MTVGRIALEGKLFLRKENSTLSMFEILRKSNLYSFRKISHTSISLSIHHYSLENTVIQVMRENIFLCNMILFHDPRLIYREERTRRKLIKPKPSLNLHLLFHSQVFNFLLIKPIILFPFLFKLNCNSHSNSPQAITCIILLWSLQMIRICTEIIKPTSLRTCSSLIHFRIGLNS